MKKLFIYGFPSLYGGAGTELHHQIYVWKQIQDLEIHIIPTMFGVENEPLYQEMLDLGITIHKPHAFHVMQPEDCLINFCSAMFLENIKHIRQFTKRTIFVNCMTWIFTKEKPCHAENLIAFSLYQRQGVLDAHKEELESLGSKAEFMTFAPYFHAINFNFKVKQEDSVHMGRISRADPGKYTKFNGHIYNGIISPRPKVGHFLGFNEKCKAVTGSLPSWINTYQDHREFSVKSFYDTVDFIVQPTNTTENWPRIGFEAMYSGKPLVVDNRGGWKHLITHGHDGFLCDNERDFMYYGSRLAYDFDLRQQIASNALITAKAFSGFNRSLKSWKKVFEKTFN